MPCRSKATVISQSCPNCEGPITLVSFSDGHGLEAPLEAHCNQCRLAWDLETGQTRHGETLRRDLYWGNRTNGKERF